MKAMVIKSFGGPDVFAKSDIPKPKPGPGQVLVKIYATSINPVDYKVRRAGSWAGINPPATIGYDIAGVVEETGPGADFFKPGDEVYYSPEIRGNNGSYTEYHVANENIVAHKPSNLTFVEAAAVPLAGMTAYDSVITRGRIRLGETALIHGGAGGVGHFAVQLAKAAGLYVFATCGNYDFDFVIRMGADRAIDYRNEDFVQVINDETGGKGVDFVFDTVGGDTVAKSLDAVRPFGRIAGIVNIEGDINKAYRKNITIESVFMLRSRYTLDQLRTLIERDEVMPMIDSVMPLEDVAKAHQRLENEHVRGKIVLEVIKE